MDKNYHIKELKVKSYPYIIFSKSFISPLENLNEVENDLSQIGARGKIIFDLLISNGDSIDRYFEAIFDGQHIIFQSIRQLNNIPKIIITESVMYYKESLHLLDNSILTKQKRFLLKKNLEKYVASA